MSTGVLPLCSQGIIARRPLPTCSIWLFCESRPHLQEVLAAGFVLGDPLPGERAVLDLGRAALASLADVRHR